MLPCFLSKPVELSGRFEIDRKPLNAEALHVNSSFVTAVANDYGYENWVAKALEFYANENDLVFLISSSGNSMNIVNAAKYCNTNNLSLITLSGFNNNNKLKELGDINFWVDSKEYNIVEMTHHIILLLLVDVFINR